MPEKKAKPLENLLGTGGFNKLVKGKWGYVLCNPNDIYVGRAIELYGEYSESEAHLFEQLVSEGDIVVEVWSNIGAHTLMFSQAAGGKGRVYAFEPQRVVFQTLCANLALNSITNVECFQAVVGEESGSVLLPDLKYDTEGNFGGFSAKNFGQGRKTPQVSLDGFLDVPRLRLVKVDVEGMEIDVLKGAEKTIEKFRPLLYVENDRVEKSPELISLLLSLRYKVYWHLPPLFNPENFAGSEENIYSNILSLNLLCVPREAEGNLTGFREVKDPGEHPLSEDGSFWKDEGPDAGP